MPGNGLNTLMTKRSVASNQASMSKSTSDDVWTRSWRQAIRAAMASRKSVSFSKGLTMPCSRNAATMASILWKLYAYDTSTATGMPAASRMLAVSSTRRCGMVLLSSSSRIATTILHTCSMTERSEVATTLLVCLPSESMSRSTAARSLRTMGRFCISSAAVRLTTRLSPNGGRHAAWY